MSGMMIGMYSTVSNVRRPKKRYRSSARAASVPSIVAISVDHTATHRLTRKAEMSSWSLSSSAYQRVLKPDQTPTFRPPLKE